MTQNFMTRERVLSFHVEERGVVVKPAMLPVVVS